MKVKLEKLLKIKVSAYNTEKSVKEILKGLTSEETEEIFSKLLEGLMQEGKFEKEKKIKKTYTLKVYYEKVCPAKLFGIIPKIGKEKLLQRLKELNITEERLEKEFKTKDGYYIPFAHDISWYITQRR